MEERRLLGIGVAVTLGLVSLTVVLGALPAGAVLTARGSGAADDGLGPVINEVAWAGTFASYLDEWIELYNPGSGSVDLSGWRLRAVDGSPDFLLSGVLAPQSFYLIERDDDLAVQDIPADLVASFGLGLHNDGESLLLLDSLGQVVDRANGDGGAWPAGDAPTRVSMERTNPLLSDSDGIWRDNDRVTRFGIDAAGNPINGTPRHWNSVGALADLEVSKVGPASVTAGQIITYVISLQNSGSVTASGVVLTDRLPVPLTFVSENGPYVASSPSTGTLVWQVGELPPGAPPLVWTVLGRSLDGYGGQLTNVVTATSVTTEVNWLDNYAQWTSNVLYTPEVFVSAVHYYALDGDDEAIQISNLGVGSADLSSWRLEDGEGVVWVPAGYHLAAGDSAWLARDATVFTAQFGFAPDLEVAGSDPAVPDLTGTWPVLANDGDEVVLLDAAGVVQDVLVYGLGDVQTAGWVGAALQPYSASSLSVAGQILYRKLDEVSGHPMEDSDAAADWAQDRGDPVQGRRVRYPGWDLETFFRPLHITQTAQLTIAVGPDHLYETIAAELGSAQEQILIQTYSFENTALAQVLATRAAAGVSVTVLLEGDPAFGLSDQERWVCQQLEQNGGRCLLMANAPDEAIFDRYSYLHAKYLVIDHRRALIGSENLSLESMPDDDKQDGTSGRRGVYLITDAPAVVAHLEQLFWVDADPTRHQDIVTSSYLGPLPVGYVPLVVTDQVSYSVSFSAPLVLSGELAFEVIQSPENSLYEQGALLGLLARAGRGDTVLMEQMHEPLQWGPAGSNPDDDPNLRLAALVEAARRGARVRLLLDGFFASNQADNEATCTYIQALARTERLALDCRTANPTALGIHNKMVLGWIGGQGYVHVGSINGSELANKGNRELALQVQSDAAYDYLAAVFERDWPHEVMMPLVLRQYLGPAPYPLISEALFNPSGLDDADQEWVELYNPTGHTVSLGSWLLGDAANLEDYEAMYQFPPGAQIGAQQFLVVAVNADRFFREYSRYPDYEIWGLLANVPDMVRLAGWGDGDFALGNAGDQVILLDAQHRPVDVLVWGSATYPGVIAHPGFETGGHSLERYPIWRDTDDCSVDFWERPAPNPGAY